MKVEFSSALHSIHPNRNVNLSRTKKSVLVKNSEPLGPVVRISFKGNEKNYNQFASIAPEDKGMGIPEYNRGGLAVVAQEAPESWNKHLNADVRTFLPYHSYDNPNGQIKVLNIPYDANGKQIMAVEPTAFKTKPVDYQLEPGEKFVIQSAPNGGKSKYVILERLDDVKGSFQKISDTGLKEETVGYQLFKAELPNGGKGITRYIMHTEGMAKFPQAYDSGLGSGAYGAYSNGAYGNGAYASVKGAYHAGTSDGAYADNCRAIVDALPKLDSEKHGHYKPANIWAHDRVAFPVINEIANKSASGKTTYYNGLRMHGTYHNPGRAYQGVYSDALDFLRIVGSPEDLKAIENHPKFEILKDIDAKRLKGEATSDEIKQAGQILDPLFHDFKDSLGTYNLTKIPLVSTRVNPFNTSSGTVSRYYGQEMMNHNSYDIAGGLTDDFAATKTVNITNGSTPANLRIDDPKANFGRGNNGLTDNKAGFTPYKPNIENGEVKNLDEILAAKQSNKKWLLNLIGNTDDNDPKALARLFFSEEQLSGKNPSSVLGKLSPYQEGDKLFMGWGRPDPQKGYPTTFEGFLKYLKDSSVSEETKKHTKLLVGAGANTWSKDARDWKNIQRLVKEIQELDNGKYKGNVMYVNGLFPNRLVACADISEFTSVFEPCGITPFESFSSGTPVISTNTGGAGEFVKNYDHTKGAVKSETGFLTEGPYLRNPEAIGITPDQLSNEKTAFDIVDDARRAKSSDEVAECFKRAVNLDEKNYRKMAQNAFLQKVDWHENAAYNGGFSANTRYMRECFQLDEKSLTPLVGQERNTKPLKRLVGAFNKVVDAVNKKLPETTDSLKATKWGKIITCTGVALIAAGTGAMVYLNKKKSKVTKLITPQPSFKTSAASQNGFAKPAVFSRFG